MKYNIKSKSFGCVLSDGSVRILSTYSCKETFYVKNIDVLNHPVWTGRRPKEQTEISAFIGRLKG